MVKYKLIISITMVSNRKRMQRKQKMFLNVIGVTESEKVSSQSILMPIKRAKELTGRMPFTLYCRPSS